MTLESGARLMATLGDAHTAELCTAAAARGREVVPDANGSKSGSALRSLAGLIDARQTAQTVLKRGGPSDISTFYGYYVLQALAKSGDADTALDFIRTYCYQGFRYSLCHGWASGPTAWLSPHVLGVQIQLQNAHRQGP
jgi:hypothetical protein